MIVDTLYPSYKDRDETECNKLLKFIGWNVTTEVHNTENKDPADYKYPDVELIVIPNSDAKEKQKLPALDLSTICVPKQITVHHIKKYILKKISEKVKGLQIGRAHV